MHLLDGVTADDAATLITKITAELPPMMWAIGRVVAVGRDSVLVDLHGELGVLGHNDGGTWRVLELDDGLRELTVWYNGQEEKRKLLRATPNR